MPQHNGVYADIIFDGTSRSSRMNVSGLYSQFIGAVTRDNRIRIGKYLEEKHGKRYMNKLTEEDIRWVYDYIVDLISYINPVQHEYYLQLSDEKIEDLVYETLEGTIMVHTPISNEFAIDDIIECMRDSPYFPDRGFVKYIDDLGREVTTVESTIIGRDYIILLDKTADEFSSVASAKVNNFMLPVKGGDFDKRKHAHSQTPITNLGETETRIVISNANPIMIAELYDAATNPITHKQIYKHMLECDGWMDENFSIDRSSNPYGNGKPVAIAKHVWRGAGVVMDGLKDDYPGGNL